MLDFVKPRIRQRGKNEGSVVAPSFECKTASDLMIRGSDFYAVWDESVKRWSTNEFDLIRLVDSELWEYRDENAQGADVQTLSDFSSKQWLSFRQYVKNMPDNFHQLDDQIAFKGVEYSKEDYISKCLPYSMSDADPVAYTKLMSVLYSDEERAKIEWAIGSIFAGEGKNIQKFLVLYGSAGAGKSTVLNIIQMLFEGYYTMFEAKELASSSNQFSTEMFRTNPLVAIQHDGDLSRIEDNTKLNSLVSHEYMVMHEKYKPSYVSRANCFIFMATNKPVKITDAKSGLIRRLIDVHPSGNKLPADEYYILMDQIKFELGSIAKHCQNVYKSMGKNYYDLYIPVDMMYKTDSFFNFVEQSYFVFKEQSMISLKQAYDMYKEYCLDAGQEKMMPRYKFRDELMNYFERFDKVGYKEDGTRARSLYSGFKSSVFDSSEEYVKPKTDILSLDYSISLLDQVLAECPAQYATAEGKPTRKWDLVETKLSDIDTKKCHYVKVPKNHIVIDFDLRDESGQKSLQKCLSEATKWPLTYAEVSQGGNGLHLHYIWEGEPESLRRVYSENIEIKVFMGNSSLRRKLTKCNNIQIATISSGLPLKEDTVVNFEMIKSEKALRNLIERNLRKEIHPGTKPSIDFIFKILEDAYASGLKYDVTDMRQSILIFAMHSTHHVDYCVHKVTEMKFASEESSENVKSNSDEIIFYDVEVFPNLFLVNWKRENDSQCVRMINPTAQDIEYLMNKRLVGFNCRRYDNHILYARYIGYTIEELYLLSQRIVNNSRDAMFREAYNLSYADVYDFCSTKQSLKKWEIELGIHHQELGLPWDQPVPEEKWIEVAEYCDNDVNATEAVFHARQEDFVARKILAELANGCPNDTTQILAGKFIFGEDKNPQSKFVYTDLSTIFPGYKYEGGHSSYRGEDPSEGGYVYAEPGMYFDVALLDIASMHPTSIEQLNLFGPYTKRFSELKQARVYIKHGDKLSAESLLNGVLKPYLDSDEYSCEALSYALKILINSIYGFTSAKFDNKFRDPRNKDNIVAKRGSLFMIDLKHAVQEKGFTVAHIKTDSIKIPNATQEIIDFVMEFGKKYGYIFEHEATYSQMCLLNNAVYVAKYKGGEWTATGAQLQQSYVFKKLFSQEPIIFDDMCETRTVTTSMYLDFNEGLKDGEHNYKFIGRAGQFTPVKPGCGGGELLREKDGKYYAVAGTKGYRWIESEIIRKLGRQNDVDISYYEKAVDETIADISKFGDFEIFRNYEECEVPF